MRCGAEPNPRVAVAGVQATAALFVNERGEPVGAIDSRGNLGITGALFTVPSGWETEESAAPERPVPPR
ncbi:MAG: hypothetical protein JWM87_705 [Candidatus Eremiobacteraeota bacterium]|nr:hypothetical protein [Candidatus Eremiobacteraeota bacterium]